VFFNLFFEAEPFAAILIARGTHGRERSHKFVILSLRALTLWRIRLAEAIVRSEEAEIRGRKTRLGKGFLEMGQQVFPHVLWTWEKVING